MIDNNVIIHEAEEYINNELTIAETAKVLGISKRTLQLHLKRLEQINENLYKKVLEKQEQAQQAGRVKGGQIGKATSNYSKEEIEKIAKTMIEQELTYRGAEKFFKIPKSTIYEILHSGVLDESLTKELDKLADDNSHSINGNNFGSK